MRTRRDRHNPASDLLTYFRKDDAEYKTRDPGFAVRPAPKRVLWRWGICLARPGTLCAQTDRAARRAKWRRHRVRLQSVSELDRSTHGRNTPEHALPCRPGGHR